MPREEFEGRFITVYFPSPAEKQHWEAIAQVHGTTLSKLALVALQYLKDSENHRPRPDVLRENESLKEDLSKARRELALQGSMLEKYEAELYRARYAAFQEPSPMGESSRSYDLSLIAFLKAAKRPVDSGQIFAHLQIDPGDREAVRLVRNQLEALERYGLVNQDSHGWRWKK
jgi:hypothetical protein